MEGIDPKKVNHALSLIDNGFIFESFASSIVTNVLGYTFSTSGGIKDRGIDGFEYCFNRDGHEKHIYQMSIEKNYKGKLEDSLNKLNKNKIDFESFTFITNQDFRDKDRIIDELFSKYKKQIRIFDVKWFEANINYSPSTIITFKTFLANNYHEYNKPGMSYEIDSHVIDPRLYVFLRQQWERNKDTEKIEIILVDTMILYALEGTDPDKGILKTEKEIIKEIEKLIKFDPKLLYDTIKSRLNILSTKPRKINHHNQENSYCLPYETRLDIKERNIEDKRLYENFRGSVEEKLKKYLKDANIKIKDCIKLLEDTIHNIFYQQGVEFADFMLKGESPESFEKNLSETINRVVDNSRVILKNKEDVKSSLIMTIRDVVYNGTYDQKIFLKKLSNTYMMLFLLKCEPKICSYFNILASKLKVYICTSIIIPAFSEYYLEKENRRHWNLLKGANDSGVTLIINELILKEIITHFKMIIYKYESIYKEDEEIYLSDENQLLYINEIMIRAYFYSKSRGKIDNFHNFINKFVSPDLNNAESDIIEWLKDEFGILYLSTKSLSVEIDENEVNSLYEELKKEKSHQDKALTDAKLILNIYAIRNKNNEIGNTGIWGYSTWWLSKDTLTYKTVNKVMGEKYPISCYMRPDFLYNYISLAPKKAEVDSTYNELFPSLLGVNISYHLQDDIIDIVHKYLRDHKDINTARKKAILRDLIEKIKSHPNERSKPFIQSYLDKEFADY